MESRVYRPEDRPDVEVRVDDSETWLPGELRMWRPATTADHGRFGPLPESGVLWLGNVSYRGPDGLTRLDTFLAGRIRRAGSPADSSRTRPSRPG